jgi:hypothetical protein
MRCTNLQRGLEQKGANRALVYSSGWMDMSVATDISSLHNLLYIQAGNMKHLLCQYPEPASSETAYLAESFSGNCWTPWSTAHFEKLTVPQPLKKFFTFYRTQSFITVFTTACHLYLASAWQTQSTNCHPVHNSVPLVSSLSLTNPVHKLSPCSFKIPVNTIFNATMVTQVDFILSHFHAKTLLAHPFYPGQTTHPIHLTTLDMTNLTISGTIRKPHTT